MRFNDKACWENVMPDATYSLEAYVSDIRKITAEETDTSAITKRIKPLALKLANTPGWMKEQFLQVDESQGFGVHLLHEEPNHDLAVFVLTWMPDRGTKPHNHLTWAVVAGIAGEEYEIEWERVDDGSKKGYAELVKTGDATIRAGQVSACTPNAIHSVWNTGKSLSISLHTYGRHINYTGRSEFDPEAKSERPFEVKVKQ
ncbi:MAG: cysteine dioxygenase family protein [Gammaproteobacteria bacterium]